MTTTLRGTGVVAWFDPRKWFGIIAPDTGGKDIFVHDTAVRDSGCATLEKGNKVKYEAALFPRGWSVVSMAITLFRRCDGFTSLSVRRSRLNAGDRSYRRAARPAPAPLIRVS